MRKIPLLCCAAVARVCKQRLREGFQTKGFPEDNITTSGMYLRILWRDFVKPPTEKPFALESNFLVRLCFFVTKGKEELESNERHCLTAQFRVMLSEA